MCGVAIGLSGGGALAQEACGTHVVAAGDNLRYLARTAYGDADLFRVIYDANAEVIGPKADHIEIGMVLSLPCAEGQVAEAAAPAAEAEIIEITAGVPVADPVAAEPEMLRIVTGDNFAPYVEETLPGGGMFTQIVEMAVFRADPSIPYTVSFVNDWQAHVDALLPSQAYDLSFPWVRPDCEGTAMLNPGDTARCENFVFSAPFLEIVDGFFALRTSGLTASVSYDDFVGTRICRPEGYTTGVLDVAGLTADRITLIRPDRITDCFEALVADEVDLVSMDAQVGDAAVVQLGLIDLVEQNPHLLSIQTLHVMAHKSNPRAVAMLDQLDEGLFEMYESGEWYEIVSTALRRANARTD
jgi:polar amino acid transport system substrate-binding protein